MDGAGTTIFDRIEQKLQASGVEVDIADLKEAVAQYDERIANNPADIDGKMIGLELKVVMLARLLNAAVDALPHGGIPASAEPAMAVAADAPRAPSQTSPGGRKKHLRQNPATGIIEEIEDTAEDNIIVADTRGKYRGTATEVRKEDKKCVFIAATDDEPVTPAKKK